MNRKLKKLAKKLKKLYIKYGQVLYIKTDCYLDGEMDFYLDIYATNPEKDPFDKESIYLFDIQTLSNFSELHNRVYDIVTREYTIEDYYEKCEIVESAHTPFYFGRPYPIFTLKKLGSITESDVYKCVMYFLKKVLGCHFIFNIKINLEYETREEE